MAIQLSKNYTALLDEVYKNASKSSILANNILVSEGSKAGTVMVPKMEVPGLAKYDRAAGYKSSAVSLTYEEIPYNYDRGVKITVDSMDNQETEEVAFGKVNGELIRTSVAPEDDAFTFAKLAESGDKVTTGAALADGTEVLAAIKVAMDAMDEKEVPEEGRILFITPANLSAIKALDTTKSREILASFDSIVKVPQARFYTAIDLKDEGGYAKAEGAKDINFQIVEKSAVIKHDKHIASDIITPEENQTADAWMNKYRKYSIVKVFENKAHGVYTHHKAE